MGRIFQARCLAEWWWSGLRYGSAYAGLGQWVWGVMRWCEDGCLPEVLGCSLSCQWVTGLSARVDRRSVIFSGPLELCPTTFLGCAIWMGGSNGKIRSNVVFCSRGPYYGSHVVENGSVFWSVAIGCRGGLRANGAWATFGISDVVLGLVLLLLSW